MAKRRQSPYIRKEIYHPSAVLQFVTPDELAKSRVREYDGDLINMGSQRYRVFAKSCTCMQCGIVGSFMAKERMHATDPNKWHFNLYAIRNDGKEVLMTKDHIVPVSRGGQNIMSNYQTMCTRCNQKKGAKTNG